MSRVRADGVSATVAFGLTRAANGAFALIGTAVPVALVGAQTAGGYFALWTATWICGVAARFGADAVLPRLVAEHPRSAGLELVRGRWRAGTACAAALAPAACLALGQSPSPWAVGLVAATALVWGRLFVIAGLLRARLHVVAAGIATNVVWASTGAIGPLAAGLLLDSASAEHLLGGTLVASLGALGIVASMHRRTRRADEEIAVEEMNLRRRGDEVVGAAALTTIYEIATWSPMVYAGLAGLEPAATAAVFAASRLAGVASWGYQSIVATTGPRLARAIVAYDAAEVRALVRRGGRLGLLVTLPLAIAGLVAAQPATALLVGGAGASAADALRVLLVARLVDAATGPIGEAFLVGRRIWLDVGLVAATLLAGASVAVVTQPTALRVAAIAAAASIATNLLRAALLRSRLISPLARGTLT